MQGSPRDFFTSDNNGPREFQHVVAEQPTFPVILTSLWNVAYQRNPFFTGREDVLTRLYDALRADATAALTQPQGISGLGGIGKTQTAVEYAYRYQHAYQTILWVRADSIEILVSDFVTIAHLLQLPEKDEQDQNHVLAAVKHWLQEHTHWLLILDNVNDLAMARDFIPTASRGHVLLTTRAQALGTLAQRIELETMEPEVGALLLLRRASIIAPDATLHNAVAADLADALEISRMVDGLPLALDQAGAYIEETKCGLSDYQYLYRTRSLDLLSTRGITTSDYPASVATTWSLSFEKIEEANPAAAELLRFCAFLYPDSIPEEIITAGASHLGPVLHSVAVDAFKLNTAIKELRRFSLLQREPDDKTLSLHRLVQVVLKSVMSRRTQRQWAVRAIRAINRTFPIAEAAEVTIWPQCQRLLPQAQACTILTDQYRLTFPEAVRLFNQAGCYSRDRALYEQAELFYQHALTIAEKVLGPEHPETSNVLNNLARLYQDQGRYEQAELFYQRALTIAEKVFGSDHPEASNILNNLAGLYQNQGRYEQIEPLYQRALTIAEKALGPEHPETAHILNNLAGLYQDQGRYEQAEPLYQRALTIYEKTLGTDHPDTIDTCGALAQLYYNQGRYAQAESLYQHALILAEKVLGPEHPETADILNNLALLYYNQGRYEQAEPLYQRALTIYEKTLGTDHPYIAVTLQNLALLYDDQGRYAQAEPLYHGALTIYNKAFGPDHPYIAVTLDNLAKLYQDQGRYEQAEPLYQRALAIREKALGPEHPDTIAILESYADLLRKMKRTVEAATLEERTKAIRAKLSF